jgi:hypothetical protein
MQVLLLTNICVNAKRIDGKNTPALEIFANKPI